MVSREPVVTAQGGMAGGQVLRVDAPPRGALLRAAGIGLLAGAAWVGFFGVLTALIPNAYFLRTIGSTPLDYLFLALTALGMGAYAGLGFYQGDQLPRGDGYRASGGFLLGFLGFGCPTCNKLLLLLLGSGGTLTFINPLRPLFGGLGVVLLGYVLYQKWQAARGRVACRLSPET